MCAWWSMIAAAGEGAGKGSQVCTASMLSRSVRVCAVECAVTPFRGQSVSRTLTIDLLPFVVVGCANWGRKSKADSDVSETYHIIGFLNDEIVPTLWMIVIAV